MVYAAEQDYQNEYLMGRKPVIRTGFDYYARQASQVIDVYTFGRLKKASRSAGACPVVLL